MDSASDPEKYGVVTKTVPASGDTEVPDYLAKIANGGIIGKLRSFEEALDRKLGVETHSIARKLPEERDPRYGKWSNQAVMFALWASGTMNLSCFATGFLGWELGLDLRRTILLIVFATLVGSAATGWTATMGPSMGLRQISISRYSIGWWPTKLVAILNAIEQVGWSSVGCITGGLALQALSNNKIGSELGVVIISVVGFVCSFIGLKAIFVYEKFAWMVFLVIFVIMYGESAKYGDLAAPAEVTGKAFNGMALILFGVVYGSSCSWVTVVSDYYVEYPEKTSRLKIFVLTTAGIPTCIGMVMGAIVASALNNNPEWAAANTAGIGFIVEKIIHPYGFAKFILFVLVLSGIGMNCLSMYSAGLSLQQFARPMTIVPRFFWTLICFTAIILLGLVGRQNLIGYLQNFLSFLGYFTTSYFIMVFSEHYIFRKGNFANYQLESWNDRSKMPIGIAGGFAFASGIVGSALGMSTTWYVGIIANKISGGDIGNQLSFLFTAVVYIPLRYLELKFVGR